MGDDSPKSTAPPSRLADWFFLVSAVALWGVMLWGIYAGLAKARDSAETTFSDAKTQASWEQWRKDAGTDEGPVTRRRPKANQPPIVILMRDMFWTCLIAGWLLSSVLYFFLAAVVRGMIRQQPDVDYDDPPETASAYR